MLLRRGDPWPDLFRECQHDAFHLELKDSYAEPYESEPLRQFLSGGPAPEADPSPEWRAMVRETVGRGVTMSRVRVVTITYYNVNAGDDIRYVPRHLVPPEDMPADDWWLFDGRLVVFNVSDADGKPVDSVSTTDPGCRVLSQRETAALGPGNALRRVRPGARWQ